MSAGAVLQAAVASALEGALAGFAVFDAPPVRGGVPHAIVEEPVLADWSTKDWTGREARVAVTLVDAGERPVRVRDAIGVVEDQMAALARDIGGGWRVATVTLVRSRLVRSGADRWRATIEYQVRMHRMDG